MTLVKKVSYWLPAIIWAGVIFGFSAQSSIVTTEIHWQDFIVKKSAHLFVYFVLAALVYRSLKFTARLTKFELFVATFMVTLLYAVSDEFHQSFTPGREPNFRDVLIDSIGSLGGLYLITKSRFSKLFV